MLFRKGGEMMNYRNIFNKIFGFGNTDKANLTGAEFLDGYTMYSHLLVGCHIQIQPSEIVLIRLLDILEK